MATEREILREFLVALGFSVDQVGARKFAGVLTQVSNIAGKAGQIVAAVGVAAEVMVTKFSRSMEKLYYASERTGSAVKNIQALEYGFGQIGLKSEDARAALERFSQKLRTNPGIRALLDTLLGRKSEGVDNTKNLRDLIDRLAELPHYQGALFAEQFGIDEQTFFHLKRWMDELTAAEQKRLDMQRRSGIDAQEAAAASREYMNALREVWERVEVLAQALSIKLLPYFREFVRVVNQLIDDMQNFSFDDIVDSFKEWSPQLKDIISDLRQMVGMFKWLIDSDPAKAVFWALKNEAKGLAHALFDMVGALTAFLSGDYIKAGKKVLSAGKYLLFGAGPEESDAERRANESLRNGADSDWPTTPAMIDAAARRNAGGADSDWPTTPAMIDAASRRNQPLGLRQNNPGNLRKWGSNAVRNGFAVFGSPQEGLSAMAQQLALYGRRGLTSIKDIVSRYAPPGENDTAAYIAAVSKQLGVGAGTSMNLNDAATLSKLMDAMIRHEQGYNPFGASETLAAAQSRVGGGVAVRQETNINVHGAGNADEVAARIVREQGRVNGDLVRNLRGAVQ